MIDMAVRERPILDVNIANQLPTHPYTLFLITLSTLFISVPAKKHLYNGPRLLDNFQG